MSIVAIVSSPLKGGNSDTIVTTMAEAAKAAGKEVEVFHINPMENRRGCQACNGCKRKGACVIKDDLTPVLDAIRKADSVILSTPVYFGEACAQYRLVEDRMFSFLNGDFSLNIDAGKKCAVVVSAGTAGAEQLADKIENTMKNFFKFEPVGKICVITGNDPKKSANDAAVLAQAKELAAKL